MPAGMVGRIGVAVSGADGNRVYALVENENGGLFVSDDAGASWKLMNARAQRPPARVLLHARLRRSEPTRTSSTCRTRRCSARPTPARRWRRSARARTATTTTCGSTPTTPTTSSTATTAAARSPSTRRRRRAQVDVERPGLSDRAVLPRGHHRAPAVPRLRLAAGQHARLCVPSDTNLGGGFGRIPPVAPYQAGGGEPGYIAPAPDRHRPLLRRHQQRRLPDPLQQAHRRAEGGGRVSRASSPASRRRTSRSAGSGPTRSSSPTPIRTCSTRRRSASGRPPTAATRGRRSAAI